MLPINVIRFGDQGSMNPPEKSSFRTLKPEKTNSLEVGFDGTFFQNRFNVNLTYYKTNTRINILTSPLHGKLV